MYCRNCGNKISDGENFCLKCGTKVEDGQLPQRKKMDRRLLAIPVIFSLIFLAGAAVCMIMELDHRRGYLVSAVEASGVPGCMGRKEAVERKWDALGIADISAKKDLLGELGAIAQEAEDFMACVEEVDRLQSEKERYDLGGKEYGVYEAALDKCTAAAEKKDGDIEGLLENARESLEALIQANDAQVSQVVDMYEAMDLSGAGKKEVAVYGENMAAINELVGADEKDYQAISQAFSKMDETMYMYLEPENPLEINVQQVDALDFPKVRLYLSVKDAVSGEVPEDLDPGMFYVRKQDVNAKYVEQVVTDVEQLNENEVLKVDMVADVSGSMDGDPLDEAKECMRGFINSVQFSAGDMVELTSFSTGVRLEQEFCDDAALLIRKIDSLYTKDMTSLYDALYTAVERAAAQSGARCVIAFTDGDDNYSNCTKEEVIAAAQRYHVPVFMIGIGDVGYPDASDIAQQTGGAYYNIEDVYSMGSIYDEIYRAEKELFLVGFEDSTGAKAQDVSDIETGYQSVEYGGECRYSYTPSILLGADGDAFYEDGPEAVVEGYMRGFADAVTGSDFSYISDYLKPGSVIYDEQQKYVQRDIKEQLDSFEIVSVDYQDGDHCVVQTRETYYVQVGDDPLQLMTQGCQYAVEQDSSGWKLTDFVGKVDVISRIRQ